MLQLSIDVVAGCASFGANCFSSLFLSIFFSTYRLTDQKTQLNVRDASGGEDCEGS